MQRFVDRSPWFSFVAAALVLALIGFFLAGTRENRKDTPPTVLRADQQALATPTTAFGFTAPTFPSMTAPTIADGPFQTIPPLGFIAPRTTAKGGTTATTRSTATTTAGSTATTGSSTATTSGPGGGGSSTTTTPPLLSIAPSAFNPNRIAYVAQGGTWSVNADGTDKQPIAPDAYTPAWSPSHTSIAVASARPGGDISVVSSSGVRTLLTSGSQDISPTWSPTGTRLAFARDSNSIWVINRDGTNLRRIVTSGCITSDPAWSSNGTHIAFWSSRDHCSPATGQYELYVVKTDGSNLTRIGTAPNSGAPAFSPDGTTIAFSSDKNGNSIYDRDIYTVQIDGSGEQRLTTASGDDFDPTWSPDGTRIAFRSERGTPGIYTMKADGTDQDFLVSGAEPSWS